MFFSAHFLIGVFGQRRIERVRIPCLEEYQEPGRIAFHLLHRIIHAVFARHALKGFDILAAQFDVAHTLILPDQLFDRLPAHIAHTRLRIVLLLLLVRHILGDDLKPGVYVIREIETQAGYRLTEETIRVVIDENYIVPDELFRLVNFPEEERPKDEIQTGVDVPVTPMMLYGLISMALGAVFMFAEIIHRRDQ